MAERLQGLEILASPGPQSYSLLDTGGGRKLERFGELVLDRPEAQAIWRPALAPSRWREAHAVFSASGEDEEKGRWRFDRPVPESHVIEVEGIKLIVRLLGLWHVGVFPEQVPHWREMRSALAAVSGEKPRVLNLFAYTGAASLIAAAAGAEVTHVDASKKAVSWARDNQKASGLLDAPVRWIVDDARKFTAREVRRGRTFHAILIDPPKFGRGPEGEVWDLFKDLPVLLADAVRLLAPGPSIVILTSYAIRASALMLAEALSEALAGRPGAMRVGELALQEASGGRLLPTSMFAKFTAEGRRP